MAVFTAESQDTRALLRGIGWMLLTGFCFVGVTGIVRYLGSDMPAIEAAFIRYAAGTVMIAPMLVRTFRAGLDRDVTRLFALRGLVHGLGVILWFYAMARIPIAEVTAIGYSSPIYVTVLAAVFLGERMHLRRIAAIVAAFVGVLLILRPGISEISGGHLAQLGAAPLFAVSYILAKQLSGRADPSAIVAMLSIGCTVVLLPGAIAQWRQPTWEEVGWLTLTAAIATTGHYTMTRAYRAAPITVTQPVTFLQLVWAALLGIALFGEPVNPFVILGGAVIIASATYISHREYVAARRSITPDPTATKL